MPDNYKSIPFLAAISILFVTPLSVGAFVYSYFRADQADQSSKTAENSTAASDFGTTQSNFKAAPFSSAESGSGDNNNSTTGIPTGKYSNPPTTIETGSEEPILNTGKSQSSISNFASSVDRNRAIQQTMNDSIDRSIPNYSSSAPSNNYNDTQDNSLIKPLENNSLTNTPQSNPEPATSLAPVTEPNSLTPVNEPLSSSQP